MTGVRWQPAAWASGGLIVSAALGALVVFSPMYVAGAAATGAAGYVGTRATLRVAAAPRLVMLIVAASSMVILRAPVLIGNNSAARLLVLGPFVLGAVLAGRSVYRLAAVPRALLLGYLAVLVVELLRGVVTGAFVSLPGAVAQSLAYLAAGWFALRYFATARGSAERAERLRAVALAPVVYAVANMALWLAGVVAVLPRGASEPGQAQLLGLLGMSVQRVNFPLAISINNFGVVCAIGLAASIVLAVRDKELPRVISIGGVAVTLACLALGDSRLSLFAGLSVGLIIALFPRLRAASGIAVLVPLAPLAILAALGFAANTSIGGDFNAEGGRDVASASGRNIIWGAVWRHLGEFNLQDLVGYGAAGQRATGVSADYSFKFGGGADALGYPVHNAVLQQIMDSGYLGALVLLGLFFVTLRRLAREPTAAEAGLFAAVITLLLAGATEVTPSYYSQETTVFFIFAAAGAAAKMRALREERDDGRSRERRGDVGLAGAMVSRKVLDGRAGDL